MHAEASGAAPGLICIYGPHPAVAVHTTTLYGLGAGSESEARYATFLHPLMNDMVSAGKKKNEAERAWASMMGYSYFISSYPSFRNLPRERDQKPRRRFYVKPSLPLRNRGAHRY